MGPILGFLKATDVGGREGAREREEEWGRKNDQIGEELLGDSVKFRQNESEVGGNKFPNVVD